MKDGDVIGVTCPMPGCQQRLIYQMDGPIRLEGGFPITVPVERHFYRCPDHGLFRFRGKYFARVEE